MIGCTAEVSERAEIGEGTSIWHYAQVRENAKIGWHCTVGRNVYIDFGLMVGNEVKVQNGACLCHGVTLEYGIFIGPYACLLNDKIPRAITPNGRLKTDADCSVGKILVRRAASVDAGAIVIASPWTTFSRKLEDQGRTRMADMEPLRR